MQKCPPPRNLSPPQPLRSPLPTLLGQPAPATLQGPQEPLRGRREAHPPNWPGKQLTKGPRTKKLSQKEGAEALFGSPWQQPGRSSSHTRTFTFLSCPLVAVVALVARWLPCPVPGHCHRCQPRGGPLGLASPPDGCWEVGAQPASRGGGSTSARRDPGSSPSHVSFEPRQLHLHHLLSSNIPRMVQGIPRHRGASSDPMWHPQAPRSIPRPHRASP